jgi:hypothetical protein
MSNAMDSCSSDSDNSALDPIDEVGSEDEESRGGNERLGVRPYRFEPRQAVNINETRDETASNASAHGDLPGQDDPHFRDEHDLSWFVY